MPAHGAIDPIGRELNSNGHSFTAVDRRASRLVDALAKMAAKLRRLPTNSHILLTQLQRLLSSMQHDSAESLSRPTTPSMALSYPMASPRIAVRQPASQGTSKHRRTLATDAAPAPPAIMIGVEVAIRLLRACKAGEEEEARRLRDEK